MSPRPTKLQIFAVIWWVATFILGFLLFPIIAVLLFLTQFRLLIALYLLWIFVIDRNIGERGGRPSDYFRNFFLWKHFADYFPTNSVLTAPIELDPNKNYMFVSFPHGILCIGATIDFRTTRGGFQKLFPHHETSSITLPFNFYIPFYRDLILAMGSCSSSKESIDYLLGYPKGGKAIGIAPGGASEAHYSQPGGIYKLVLKKRKGFIKLAVRHGTPIIPLFSFGEIDLFEQVYPTEGSLTEKLFRLLKWITRINFIMPKYGFAGLIPNHKPVTIVCKCCFCCVFV